MHHHHRAVYEVAEVAVELGVDTGLEVFPGEVVVFRLRRIGAEHIAQQVLPAGKIQQVFMHPDRPVARGAYLLAFDVEKLVGRHRVGQHIASVRLQHRREDDAVEYDIVFADEMYQLRVFALPVIAPHGRQLLSRRDVANGRVKPHVEHFAFCTLDGHRHAPGAVSGHGAGLQAGVYPAFTLAVYIAFPLVLLAGDNPFAQPFFVLIQWKIPVLGKALFRDCIAQCAFRIDELLR